MFINLWTYELATTDYGRTSNELPRIITMEGCQELMNTHRSEKGDARSFEPVGAAVEDANELRQR